MWEKSLLEQLKKHAVKKGEFKLSSGEISNYYIDLKKAYTRPEIMESIVSGMQEKIKDLPIDKVAGMELGGVPLAAALSMKTKVPFIMIRKEKKGHGATSRIEGEIDKGDSVLLLEDVVTTGGSLVSAANAIIRSGGRCANALAVVDRLSGGKENLKKINIELDSLLTIKDLGLR